MTLDSLPNEVYIEILSDFSTRDLLPLAPVNRRFHALVLRILHHRLLLSTPLKEYQLLLECFHPTSKLTEPHAFCKYLGINGLSEDHASGTLYEDADAMQQRVTAMYSRFRPQASNQDEQERVARRFGVLPGRMFLSGEGLIKREEEAIREVTLDGYEDFSQLCVVASLVQVRPGTSLLLSASTIEDGVVRLWRDWLYRQSRKWKKVSDEAQEEGLEETQISSDSDDMLWVDLARTVGLKMRVRPKSWNPSLPVLMHEDDRDDDAWVGYEIVLEELHIRATRLLLALERSKEEQEYHQNNAIVIGAPAPS
ncbi:uncharacterized protein N7506_007647 [Penicillium brevicompactum]|uniref:uncharacterized protein n=1 Tax=Penicillium brevicompactum TaxID=5074 RepID=UPI0025424DBA|nr:uncharacterized protein N7506_007647 [Penicillium brevicompactum]KAJ5333864.1 hypothetical protein N7506_007647 [Penicillium brevicompactum]